MKAQRREKLARQLEAISKRANSVISMMEEGDGCIDVLHHLQAVSVALNKIKMGLLEDYLERWAAALVQGEDPEHCEHLLKEFPVLFKLAGKTYTPVVNHPWRKSMITNEHDLTILAKSHIRLSQNHMFM